MTQPDPVLARLHEGIQLRLQGRHAEARVVMEQLWNDMGGADGAPLHRCTIAHSLADTQDEVDDELRWDLAALDAAREVTDADVAAAGMGDAAAALMPSLYLNLAECYRKLGQYVHAREHLLLGSRSVDELPAGEYGDSIRGALADLARRLDRG